MSSRLPWFKFYPNDWMTDDKLQTCSLAAQGFMIKAVCILFGLENRGVFKSNAVPWTDDKICRRVGGEYAVALQCLDELLAEGALGRSKDGAVYSRRMVRDEEKRRKCSEAGERGGGNPALRPIKEPIKVGSKVNPNVPSDSGSGSYASLRFEEREKKSTSNGRGRTAGLYDETWPEFRVICFERKVLPSSQQEWNEFAAPCWNVLDAEKKLLALADMRSRPIDDPVCRMRVCNYLKGEEWTRPIMRVPKDSPSSNGPHPNMIVKC